MRTVTESQPCAKTVIDKPPPPPPPPSRTMRCGWFGMFETRESKRVARRYKKEVNAK